MRSRKLYVGNLDYSVTKNDLENLFSEYGEVVEVRVMEGKGFGFIEMSSPSETEKAKEALSGTDIKGRSLKVGEELPPKRSGSSDHQRYY